MVVGGAVRGLGTVMVFTAIMLWVYRYVIKGLVDRFQTKILVGFENWYEGFLKMALRKRNAYYFFFGTFIMLFVSIFLFGGDSIKGFMFAMIVGVMVGTYSSLFIASPIMYDTTKKLSKEK